LLNLIKKNIETGGLPIHAALINYCNNGILLGGNNGCGKTTCSRRLPQGWIPLCDDMAIIEVLDDNMVNAIPFPNWTEHLSEPLHLNLSKYDKINLNTIFFLKQSKTLDIVPLTKINATLNLVRLSCQICSFYWRNDKSLNVPEWRSKIFTNSWDIVQNIPCYLLYTSLLDEFWKEIEKVL
jgi:SynChlorMet cassette protein ScmC